MTRCRAKLGDPTQCRGSGGVQNTNAAGEVLDHGKGVLPLTTQGDGLHVLRTCLEHYVERLIAAINWR